MSDLDHIKQIEQALNVKLKQLDEIDVFSTGYTVNQQDQVTGVGLYGCKIKKLKRILSPLVALTSLTTLDLESNQIRDLTPLAALNGLTILNVSYNQLRDLTPLGALPLLTTLQLDNNQISDLAPLAALTSLTILGLFNNQISDLAPLAALNGLATLNVGDNQISDLTSLAALTDLTILDLHRNQIRDIAPLAALTGLTILNLYGNQIRDIVPLASLTGLTEVYLFENQIRDLAPLKNLKHLERLNIYKNPIEALPAWITDFNMEIQWKDGGDDGYITLYDNPLKTPPPEIVKQGKAAVRNYFQQLQAQAEDYLFEAKLLIVGEPGAGKTSLAWKMENANCDLPKEEETTKGIDVLRYEFPVETGRRPVSKLDHSTDWREDETGRRPVSKLDHSTDWREDETGRRPVSKLDHSTDWREDETGQRPVSTHQFRLNIWDFGGQEIYKATHRFFLSKRALYALVADSRNEDTDFNYWLHIVELFGGVSPLLIVLNEKHQRKRNLDTVAMRKRFTNIVEVLDVDLGDPDQTRLHKLARAVKYYAAQLPHVGSPVPAKWTVVREALEHDPRNTITLPEYLALCKANGIAAMQDALVLSQYFHDIGVFLHFQEDDLLNKTLFLKPNWATIAVYKILDHPLLNQQQGRFDKHDAQTIWCEEEYRLVCSELLRLMHKFFLTYEIDRSGAYIVPERLPAVQPDYPWDDRANLMLQYEYEVFMPKGMLSQFTVQMHRYIRNHDYVWKRGVILEREQTLAEIIESYDARRITIRIAGKHCRDLMTLITEQFDQINAQYEKMQVEKLIPCNCAACKAAATPFFYKYNDLQRRIEKGRQEVECGESYQMVNVRSLLDDVINPGLHRAGMSDREDADHLINAKLSKLLASYVIETEPTRKFQLEHQIQEVYDDNQKFGGELNADNAKRMKAFMAARPSGG